MATIFTKIIIRELPGAFVHEDEHCVAFLSINPLTTGHTLVVPRVELDHWLDCPPELRDHLMEVATAVGDAQMKVWSPERIGLIVAGFEVPHLHLHVFPSWSMADFDFAGAASMQPMDVLEPVAARIRAHLTL
jgi:diadenosine tetraphosphate (Ap4A) HIT family hydrolase